MPGYNIYANPIEGSRNAHSTCRPRSHSVYSRAYTVYCAGIEMAVDMGNGDVWMFKDREVVPIPPPDVWSEYAALPPGLSERKDVKPLYITQPEGPSFTVDGFRVRGWSGNCLAVCDLLGFSAP